MSGLSPALAQQLQTTITAWNANQAQFADWLGGVVGGGPNDDGRYPLTNALGVETLVSCPAAIIDAVAGPAAQAEIAKLAADASAGASASSATAADASKVLAEAARNAAITARTQAQTAQANAANHEANARYWAELAQGQGADVGAALETITGLAEEVADNAALAAQDAEDAAASAAAAATFNPDLFDLKADTLAASRLTGMIDIARIPVLPSQKQFASSGGLADLTSEQLAEIGQGSVVTTTDGFRYIYKGSGSKTDPASYTVLADITPSIHSVTDKPAFWPTNIANVSGLQSALDAKAGINEAMRSLYSADTRNANPAPNATDNGLRFDFKSNSTNNLADGGSYNGVLTIRPYSSASDFSGGPVHQLGFTDAGNLWTRRGDGTGWYSWNKLWHSGNDGAGSGLDADHLRGQQPAIAATGSTIVERDSAGSIRARDIQASRGDGTGVLYLNGANDRYLYYDGSQYFMPTSGLSVGGTVTSGGNVVGGVSGNVQAGSDGFYIQGYNSNARNRIFSFANAQAHGISYNQGSSGSLGYDTITLHPNGQPGSFAASMTVDHFGRTTFGPNARALSIGYSGGNYGGLGYNLAWTNTSDTHTVFNTDTASLLDFPSGGMSLRGTGTGASGRTASWTYLLQVPLSGNMLHRGSTVWTAANHGPGSGLNADTVDGLQASHLLGYNTLRDFTNGTLVVTDIDYSVDYGDVFQVEITGNTYGQGRPVNTTLQGYIYNGTIINAGITQLGYRLTGVIALLHNGSLCFWWPRQAYWHGYKIKVTSEHEGVQRNRVTQVVDSSQPGSAKLVQFSGTSLERFIDYESNSEKAYSIPVRGSNGYLNQRVIQNVDGASLDGMYIGYGNANGGWTRVYGGGSTYQSLYVGVDGIHWHDTGGNLNRVWARGQIPVDSWQTDVNGHQRFYFANGSNTYLKSQNNFVFRNVYDQDILVVEPSGRTTIAENLTTGGSTTASTFYTGNWYRSTGATGWFNQDYSVGIYSTQAGQVRTYNGASFEAEGGLTVGGHRVPKTTYSQGGSPSGGVDGDVHIVW